MSQRDPLTILGTAAAGLKEPTRRRPRPRIVFNERQLREVSQDSYDAVLRWNRGRPRIFERGNVLCRVRTDREKHPAIEPLSVGSMKGILSKAADWFRVGKNGEVPAFPPREIAQDLLARPEWPEFPVLRDLIEAPTFASDGHLVGTPGYDEVTGLWLHLSKDFHLASVAENPADEQIAAAKAILLDELLGDFPFVDHASRAHALAIMLLPFVRELIHGPTPLHAIDSPTPGTGKGLLTDVLAVPAIGRAVEKMAEAHNDEEWRKRLSSALLTGQRFLVIDNIKDQLDSGALAAMLTESVIQERQLGHSRMLRIPVRSVWIAAGNNLSMSQEIARRSAPIRLDAKSERPWQDRKYRHEQLVEWAQQNRGRLVHACLTLVQAWLARGRPRSTVTPLGRYEEWSAVMGGILKLAGVAGFLTNVDMFLKVADEETREWTEFFTLWWTRFEYKPVGVKVLLGLVESDGLLGAELGDGNDRSRQTRFGKALRARRDRPIGGYRMVDAGTDHRGVRQYQLEQVEPDHKLN
jgi:putative DNA primase/helicase